MDNGKTITMEKILKEDINLEIDMIIDMKKKISKDQIFNSKIIKKEMHIFKISMRKGLVNLLNRVI